MSLFCIKLAKLQLEGFICFDKQVQKACKIVYFFIFKTNFEIT